MKIMCIEKAKLPFKITDSKLRYLVNTKILQV